MSVTILGQHISLVRPAKVARPITVGAWKPAKQTGRKTRKLTMEMKQEIARELGFSLTQEGTR